MKVGLTLGKFAPLHKGHQLVIETALAEMDHVIVIVYQATQVTQVPLEVRAGWIRALYPSVEVIEAHDGPQDTGYTKEIIDLQEGYLKKILQERQVAAFYSSEPYGEHVSKALCCENRIVDLPRHIVAVSGTAIRKNFSRYKDDLHPIVKAHLLTRLIFLGGPSTGKTTLAFAAGKFYNEAVCEEYGRNYWECNQINHRLSMTDLEIIAQQQLICENRTATSARQLVIADTSPLTTLTYSYYYFGEASGKLLKITEEYHKHKRLLVVCGDDIPFDDTPDRSGTGSRKELQEILLCELKKRGLEYEILEGTIEKRLAKVQKLVDNWRVIC